MKTDSLFYHLFQTLPHLFFELLGQSTTERAEAYSFRAVELKQTAFRLDGIFVPPATEPTWPLFFVEVQFQRDPDFYSRFFAELFLYLRQYQPIHPWQAADEPSIGGPRRSREGSPSRCGAGSARIS
jgi:predicted transposase/invertase (TIGR01784 family)